MSARVIVQDMGETVLLKPVGGIAVSLRVADGEGALDLAKIDRPLRERLRPIWKTVLKMRAGAVDAPGGGRMLTR